MYTQITEKLQPNRDILLRLLSEIVDDDMLYEIAAANYGKDLNNHFQALVKIRDNFNVSISNPIYPLEVLELVRWSEPDDRQRQHIATGKRGHIMRAFCCCVLLRATNKDQLNGSVDGENETLAQLLTSIEVLGPIYEKAALRFIAWLFEQTKWGMEERPFFILSMLFLALRVNPALSNKDISKFTNALIREERHIRNNSLVIPEDNQHWLLGLTFFNQKHTVWIAIGKQLSDLSQELDDENVRKEINSVADKLVQAIPTRQQANLKNYETTTNRV